MNMIERVARAMVAGDSGPQGSILFDIHWKEFGDGYMKGARAAIEEMLEPTQGMVEAGVAGVDEVEGDCATEDGTICGYQSMIRAALEG